MSFVTAVYVSRNMAVYEYGVLQLATTWFLFIQVFEHIINANVAKIEMIKNPNAGDEYISAIAVTTFGINLFFVMALGIYYMFSKEAVTLLVLIMTSGQLLKVYTGYLYKFDSELRAIKSQGIQFFGNLIGSIYKIVAAEISGTALSQSFAILVTNIACIGSLLKISRRQVFFRISPNFYSILKRMTSNSLPFFTVSLLSLIAYKQDVLILGYFNMELEVAQYVNAVKLSEPWGFIASGIVSSLLPGIILSKRKSLTTYYQKIRIMFSILIYSSLLLALFFHFFAETIILGTFGEKYVEAAPLVRILIWSNVFLFYITAQQIWEVNERIYKFVVIKFTLAIALNFALNYYFVPKYGALACAYNSLITYCFLGVIINFFHKKTRFINRQFFLSILMAPFLLRDLVSRFTGKMT